MTARTFQVLARDAACPGPLPASTYPYPSFLDVSWTNRCSGATAIEITFDPQTRFENGFDFLHITDGVGRHIPGSPFSGDGLAGRTVFVRGDTVVLRLETDSAVSDWGFKVSEMFALSPNPNPSAVARHGLTFLGEVQYQGPGLPYVPWYDRVYVSTNATWTTDAIPIWMDFFQADLPSNASYSQIANIPAPNLPAGNYYLIFRGDDGGFLTETNESNNELAIPLHIENVDLAAFRLQAPGVAAPQQPISITWKGTNLTARAALPDWYDYLYIRQGENSNYLDRVWHNELVAGGGAYTVKHTAYLPSLAAGTYNLEIQVNPLDLAETNLENNVLSIPISIVTPDLVGLSVLTETNVPAGEWFSAEFTISNTSPVTAYGPWVDVAYLSRTNHWTPEAIRVAETAEYDEVGPHGWYRQHFDINISADYIGEWFLIFQTDGGTNLADANMEDNFVAVPLRIDAADLEPTIFRATIGGSVNLVAAPQQSISINWRVQNKGAVMAERGWTDTILLATDPGGTNVVAVLGTIWQLSRLSPTADYGRSTTVRAAPVPPGDYFLVFQIDRENYQPESNDFNNTTNLPIRIIDADLAIQALTAPASVAPEQPFNVNWAIRNLGPGTAFPPWEDVLYLANTNDLDVPLQTLLRRSSTSSLGLGAAYNLTQSVRVSSLPAGDYALVLDTRYSLYPSDFDVNDRAVTPIRVQGPDIIAAALFAPSSVCLHSNVYVTFVVSNAGSVSVAGPWETQFYLSSSPVWSPQAALLGTFTSPATLPAHSATSIVAQVYLSGFPAGSYFLIGRVEPIHFADPNTSNNTVSRSLAISAADLIPESLVVLEPSPGCPFFSAASPHSYPNNFVFSATHTCPGAAAIRISFDPRTDVGADLIEIVDRTGSPIAGSPFTANQLADASVKILGDTVQIRFSATHGQSNWGFAVTNIQSLSPTLNITAAVQQPLDFQWRIRNQGQAPGLWQALDLLAIQTSGSVPNSQVITALRGAELPGGSSYQQDTTAILPPVKPGHHSLVLYADGQFEVEESSETNNVLLLPIDIVSPDLSVTDLQAPPILDGQSSFEVVWSVQNNGPVDAFPYWTDRLYVCPTDRLTPQAQEISSHVRYSSLRQGDTYSVTQSLTLPPLPLSDYFLIVKADADTRLYDSFTDGNELAIPLTIRNPDFVATNFQVVGTGPLVFPPQAEIELSYTVLNLGLAPVTSQWWDQIYFSGDRVVDEDAIPLMTDLYGSNTLAVGASYQRRPIIRLPPEDEPGDYYLILSANAYGNVAEKTRANNTLFIPIRLASVDLEITNVVTTNQAAPYQSINVAWTVRNRGTGAAAPPWSDSIYFSQTPTLPEEATPLASRDRTEPCLPGGTYSESMNVVMPNAAPGNYYLIVRADSQSKFSDATPTNNLAVLPITIALPDLHLASLTSSQSNLFASPQTGVDLQWRVQNLGTGVAATNWTDGFYLSLDPELDTNDVFIGGVPAPHDLAPGSEYVRDGIANVGSIAPGNYYLFLKADAHNERPESDETNNALWVQITVGEPPDLRPLYLNAPATLEMSNRSAVINVDWGVTNQGAASTAVTWYDNIYLSRDARYDFNDLRLTARPQLNPVAPGGSYTAAEAITLQVNEGGLYYLLLWVDGPGSCPEGCVYELDQTNNIIALPIQVTLNVPDLVVTEVRAPQLVVSSADYVPTELKWVIRNQGPGTVTGSWSDGLYVNGKHVRSTVRNPPLAPGASYTNVVLDYLVLPTNGTYTVTIQADDSQPFNDVFETVETNNARSASFQFARSPKELLLAGESGSVPLFLATPLPASEIELDLFAPTGKVTSLSASAGVPQLAGVATLPTGPGRYHIQFASSPNQFVIGTQEISRIQFQAASNQHSAFVPFTISNLTVRTAQGAVVPDAFARVGRGVIIGAEPLMEATPVSPGQHALTLYGLPTSNVVLQTRIGPATQTWSNLWQGSFTNRLQGLGPYPTTDSTRLYRARY